MKIIGFGKDNETVILIAGKNEVCNIKGSSYGDKFSVGEDIAVSEIYHSARETLESYVELKKAISRLQTESSKLLSNMKGE